MSRVSRTKALPLAASALLIALVWHLGTASAHSADDVRVLASSVGPSTAVRADGDSLDSANPDHCYPYPCAPCGGCPIIIVYPWGCPPLLFAPEPTVPAPPPGGQSTPMPTATQIPVPTPTPGGTASGLTYNVCRQMDKEIPTDVQQKALAEPWRVYGYNRLQNPNIPYHPLWNPYRTHLTVRDFAKRYGRCNDIMWKASCP